MNPVHIFLFTIFRQGLLNSNYTSNHSIIPYKVERERERKRLLRIFFCFARRDCVEPVAGIPPPPLLHFAIGFSSVFACIVYLERGD